MSGRRGLRCAETPGSASCTRSQGAPDRTAFPHQVFAFCSTRQVNLYLSGKALPPSFRERRRIFRQKVANLANATFAKMKVANLANATFAKTKVANLANATFAKMKVANLANATFAKMKVANLAVPVHVPAHVPVPVPAPAPVPVPVRKGSCCLLSCFFFLSNTAGSGNSGGGTRTPPLKGVEKQPAPANKKARMETVVCIHAGFVQVAPAGVEPAMGESKSPALPLGDGASFIARRPGGPRTPCKSLYHICRACASAAHQIQPITRSGR